MKQKEFFIDCPKDLCYIFDGKQVKIQNTLLPTAFYSILGIMAEDSNYCISNVSYIHNYLDISGWYRGKESFCRILFCAEPNNNIVVQNVHFIHQRQGYMTQLYRVLKHIKRTYRTGDIIIQSALTDAGKSWCEKNGFVSNGYGDYVKKSS